MLNLFFLNNSSYFSGLESREYVRGDQLRWSRNALYPQKLALTSPTSGVRSVGLVISRTKAIELILLLLLLLLL
jgi:hypothetical protein